MSWPRARVLGVVALVLALLVGLAVVTAASQRQSRRQLDQRFVLRTTLGARFTATYARSVVALERRRALESLSGPRVTERQFRSVVSSLQFPAAVLLDGRGRVLRVWPPKPALIGTPIAGRYPHLAAAVGGQVGISNVVPSAARGVPVVAFAVPFQSAAGRRVFSGAFAVGSTPVAAYLATALPYSGGELSVVDAQGEVVVDNHPGIKGVRRLRQLDPALAEQLGGERSGSYRRGGVVRFFATEPVAGTPWQLAISVPEKQLFAPISGASRLVPWILFAGFAFVALLAGLLFVRLSEKRTMLATANNQLAASNRELRELDQLKDDFVALVSHELRTPLTSIIGYASALQRGRGGELTPKQSTLLTVVERNANRLLRVVGDLLFVAKADAGKLKLEPELLDLSQLAKEAVGSARPHAETQQVRLELIAGETIATHADQARLTQVLDNLLSNAIKFTPAGGHVRVSVTAHYPNAQIEVRDDGIGIPADQQGETFNRFFRATTATSQQIHGTGLGLSITKTIVELHRGSVKLSSREGCGTTVIVTLPITATAEAAAA